MITERTPYGNNLCRTCSTYAYPCNYTFTRRCSSWLGNYSRNGTIVWPLKNSTTKARQLPTMDLSPDWGDRLKDGGESMYQQSKKRYDEDRKKRHSPYQRPDRRRPNWNTWNNNYNG